MSSKINVGDLVWSEYYSRLGVVSRIITDPAFGYSEESPGYDLVDPVHGKDAIVGGEREHGVFERGTSNETHCHLVKLANGYMSAREATQAAIADDEIGD